MDMTWLQTLQTKLADEARSAPLLGRCFLLAHSYLNAIQMGTATTDLQDGTDLEKATWGTVHEYFARLRQEAEKQ